MLYICTEQQNTIIMKITVTDITDSYGEKSKLHTIELNNRLNLGNNFNDRHFRSAIEENEEREELHDYLYQQDTNDSYKVIAQGNYGMVSSGIGSIYEVDYIFED